MKRLISVAMAALCAVAQAATITVKNFDADLATVYVNDRPTTNGQQVVVDGTVKIELGAFGTITTFAMRRRTRPTVSSRSTAGRACRRAAGASTRRRTARSASISSSGTRSTTSARASRSS